MRPRCAAGFLLCLLTLVPYFVRQAFGQADDVAGQIHGSVRDFGNQPVGGARIRVFNTQRGFEATTETDDAGEYRIARIPPDTYEVEAFKEGYQRHVARNVRVSVGGLTAQNFDFTTGVDVVVVDVFGVAPVVETQRSRQANTLRREIVTDLPIDRRDYLTFSLLAPGVTDSKAMADDADFRVVQTPNSGLSFYGSNGRGNFISVDGGEANDSSGGVRPTLSQEAVEEFQINRSNYSAELGGASGGVINIVSKSGTNQVNGSLFGFLRHQSLDATDPFATMLQDGRFIRTKPPADRQQFGGSIGFPIARNRTFGLAAFEHLNRDESSVVSVLTDNSIFEPTADQNDILSRLPEAQAAALRRVLTAPQSTRDLFALNNGAFPFHTSDWKASIRLDHRLSSRDDLFFRYNFAQVDESNASIRALVGATRGYGLDELDHTSMVGWTRRRSSALINEARFQWNYRGLDVASLEPFGPQIDIPGFGFFNRDTLLPSKTLGRRYEVRDNVSYLVRGHDVKFGGALLARQNYTNPATFAAGRFTFGPLPGALVSPALASTTITALQAFNLGLASTYQQGFGNTELSSTDPYYAFYVQDTWKATQRLTLDVGLRYELDDRRDPIRTDKNNFAPRIGFAWDPFGKGQTVIRGGYGVFYSQIYYQIDYVVNALGEIDGRRPIAQVFTSILTPGLAASNNIFTTLRNQGVIGVPTPARQVTQEDLVQFGIRPSQVGPRPPSSVLFAISPDYANPYSQQASLGVEHEIAPGTSISASTVLVRTLKITRARDANLLPAPIDPRLGIPVWSTPYFVDPLLAQLNVYESTARASYAGLILEFSRRASRNLSVAFNYTFSKAIDDVVDFNSDFQANDQTNHHAEKALSSFHQHHRVTAFGVWNAFGAVEVSPILRFATGRPFNLLVGTDLNQDRHSTTDRPPFAGQEHRARAGLLYARPPGRPQVPASRRRDVADDGRSLQSDQSRKLRQHQQYRGRYPGTIQFTGPARPPPVRSAGIHLGRRAASNSTWPAVDLLTSRSLPRRQLPRLVEDPVEQRPWQKSGQARLAAQLMVARKSQRAWKQPQVFHPDCYFDVSARAGKYRGDGETERVLWHVVKERGRLVLRQRRVSRDGFGIDGHPRRGR